MTEAEEIKQAERAKELLKDPVLIGALETMEREYHEKWKDTQPEDTQGREILWQLLWAIGEFRSHLSVIMQRGEFHINHLDKVLKRKKS